MMYGSGESNYRTAPTASTSGPDPPSLQSQPSGTGSTSQSIAQSSSHMSVAAKAGEMQIFSSDILSQVNGLQRRQTNKAMMLRKGVAKLTNQPNDPRLANHVDHLNNLNMQENQYEALQGRQGLEERAFASVDDPMLHIEASQIKPISQTNNRHADMKNMLSTLQSSTNNDRNNQPLKMAMPRDSLGASNGLQPITNQQRLHPTQSFGEYVASNTNTSSNQLGQKGRIQKNLPSQYIGNRQILPSSQLRAHQLQPLNGVTLNGTGGLQSKSHLTNSQTAIGSFNNNEGSKSESCKGTRQNSPIVLSQISEKHLKIEVTNSTDRRNPQVQELPLNRENQDNCFDSKTMQDGTSQGGATLFKLHNIDQAMTPTVVRRSVDSRAGQLEERMSVLEKAGVNVNFQPIDSSTFDVKNPSQPTTTTVKKLQAAKYAQQQLLQNRYTNGTEPNMLPKMAGLTLDRKSQNNSKQTTNTSMPPPGGNLSLIQQSQLRRRHGDNSYGGAGNSRLDFGVSGESLQIKLTGTSIMKQNQPRESNSQQFKKEVDQPLTANDSGLGHPPASIVYHPKLRSRLSDLTGTNFNGFQNPASSVPVVSGVAPMAQSQFAQHIIDMQMNSPRNSNQIFQDNGSQPRIYSYHYIYDYLFVQVTEEQYSKEYAHRIRTFIKVNETLGGVDENQKTPDRGQIYANSDVDESEMVSGTHSVPQKSPNYIEVSPETRGRGPTLKLNQNQVFFSPQINRDLNGKIIGGNHMTIDEAMQSRFGQNTIDHLQNSEFSQHNPQMLNSLDPSQGVSNRKQVVKMKRLSIKNALENALQSTQYEGLKILAKDSILRAQKSFQKVGLESREEYISQPTSSSNIQKEPEPSGDKKLTNEEEQLGRFMQDLGRWLQEQGMRFKVTVKKKYINDILMNSKGAQNLAQNVVVVVTNNSQLSMNSPQKRQRRGKRNISVEVSSGEDEIPHKPNVPTRNTEESAPRNHGQATPQVHSSKAKAGNIGRRGYESENEAKSFNSTTTSSTFPNLKMGYATKQNNTPRQPRKMSTRSQSNIPSTVRVQRKVTDDINGHGAAGSAIEDPIKLENEKKYPVTKIKIVQDVNKYNDHSDHPINKMLNDYNEFIRLVFRSRTTEARAIQNIPYAIKLGKRLGISLTKNQLMPATLKVRENANAIKEKLIFYMCKVIRQENDYTPQMDATSSFFKKPISDHTNAFVENQKEQVAAFDSQKSLAFHYRCYVGKGNNQMMIRALFKNRFWWLFHEKEEPEKVNFFWTQLRKLSIMNSLNCKLVNPKDKNQQKHLQSLVSQSQVQSLGLAIAQNSALMSTPSGGSKFKRRKLSSAQSKSPDNHQLTAKLQNNHTVGGGHSEIVSPSSNSAIAMTMVGLKNQRQSETSVAAMTEAEEKKADIAPVTAAPAQSTIASLLDKAIPKEEPPKKEEKPQLPKIKPTDTYPVKLANKIEDNYHLCNKKALFVNMKNYYEAIGENPFDALPVTFHIKEGLDDPNFEAFKNYYEENQDPKNIWITKPGECTNRGVGIQVASDWHELQSLIAESTRSSKRTCIVQKYIHNPLLIHRRKFDIRTFCMATTQNGNYKAYYYEEGYMRTSCREFTLQNLSNRMVHLTNDAVQKKAEDYGKFEPGNKLSYAEFQNYLDKYHGNMNVRFDRDILPQIKKLTTDCFRASWGKMDPYKRFNTFECFGLDFMIDENFKVFLIEVNTNPCLELSSPLLARLIPSMVENAIRLAVDPIFPPPEHFSQRKHVVNELCPENRFQLIFDEKIDGPELIEVFREKDNIIIEIDEEELSDADIDGKENQDCPAE